MKKKAIFVILSAIMALTMIFGSTANVSAASDAYTVSNSLKGKDFTNNPLLADALDKVFAGKLKLYKDKKLTKPVTGFKLGSRSANSNTYYVGTDKKHTNSGESCWIYANGVYSTLFNDYVYDSKGQAKGVSETIVKNSKKAKNNSYLISYDHFVNWNVRTGAYLRTVPNGKSVGHSMIVLKYDKNYLYTLEGNYEKGAVGILKTPWSSFKNSKRVQKYVQFIVQPKQATIDKLYPIAKLSYNANGEDSSCIKVPSQQVYAKNDLVVVSKTTPTRNGYNFKGWATSPSGAVKYSAGSKFKIQQDTTLYAIWAKKTYTVTFDGNGGSGGPAGKQYKVLYLDTLKVSTSKPSRQLYEFLGWSTSKGGDVQYKPGNTITVKGDMTLYAVWYWIPTLPDKSSNGDTGWRPIREYP